MKITFLGTRGNIESRTRVHKNHSSLLVEYYRRKIMIDAGGDWLGKLDEINPDAILLTHAHPDHAFGLKDGSPSKVFATEKSWKGMKNFPVEKGKKFVVKVEDAFKFGKLFIEAFSVEHSIKAPAVGYKISAGNSTIFYSPDIIYVHNREEAFKNVDLYIGDGATINKSFIRKRNKKLIGHATIDSQLAWCEKDNIPRAIITHCGSQIVDGDGRKVNPMIQNMGKERGVDVEVAADGMELVLK